MKKEQAIRRWADIPADQPILPHFTPIAADAKGSTFGACGIRISGNPEFIDAVLSRLKDLLSAEAGSTRLALARNTVKPVFDKAFSNADTDAETCYIQIRERTAKTRQRKVREMIAPLPHLADGARNDTITSKPPTTEATERTQAPDEDDEPRKVAHIGCSDDGEVFWD